MRAPPVFTALAPIPGSGLLCIEDNPVNALLLQEFLGRLLGLQVLLVDSGAQGLELARTQRPWALLLDLVLPDMGGLAVLAQLRADPLTRDLPVVVISAVADHHSLAAVWALGARAVWTKPLDFSRLEQMLVQALPEMAVVARCTGKP